MTRARPRSFSGPFAITIARGIDRPETVGPRLNILAPVTGTATSRRGAEFAIPLAPASRGSVTALHFVPSSQRAAPRSWQREVEAAIAPMRTEDAVVREIVKLGDPYGIAVKPAAQSAGTSQDAILHQIKSGRHNLVVLGVSVRLGEQLDFGQTAAALLDKAGCSLMFLVSEQPTSTERLPQGQSVTQAMVIAGRDEDTGLRPSEGGTGATSRKRSATAKAVGSGAEP